MLETTTMNTGKILYKKQLTIDNIHVSLENHWFEYEPELQQKVDVLWRQKVQESASQGSTLWDGNNYRIIEAWETEDTISLTLWYTKYRNIWCTRYLQEEIAKLTKSECGSGAFVAGFIKTNDGKYLIGELAGRYLRAEGMLEIIGGVLQPDDTVVTDSKDIYAHFLRELQEEAGIPKEYVSEGIFMWLIQLSSGNIGIIFSADLILTSQEAKKLFESWNDKEMKRLWFFDKEEILTLTTTKKEQLTEALALSIELL